MRFKKIIKLIFLSIGILLITILIYSIIPRVSNPSPEFQTELAYGNPVTKEVKNTLTPTEEPQRKTLRS